MTLVKGLLKPKKESQSVKHDRICLSLFEQADRIIPWAADAHCAKHGWKNTFEWDAPSLEFPIMKSVRGSSTPKTIGYIDMFVTGKMETFPAVMIFEVKPTILSLGEVLRQVHRYKEAVSHYAVRARDPRLQIPVVVSASNEYASVLGEHGVLFVDTAWLTTGQES